MASPEYQAVLESTEALVTGVQHCIGVFTSQCLSKGLISEEDEKFTFTPHDATEKARKLVSSIRDGIRTDPNRFQTLVDVIKGISYLDGQVETLQRRHSKNQYKLSILLSCNYLSFRQPL
jgi:hypothetical protein